MVWACYKIKGIGSNKNGYENEHRRIEGKPEKWWSDAAKSDMRTTGVCVDVVKNRVTWKFKIRTADSK